MEASQTYKMWSVADLIGPRTSDDSMFVTELSFGQKQDHKALLPSLKALVLYLDLVSSKNNLAASFLLHSWLNNDQI